MLATLSTDLLLEAQAALAGRYQELVDEAKKQIAEVLASDPSLRRYSLTPKVTKARQSVRLCWVIEDRTTEAQGGASIQRESFDTTNSDGCFLLFLEAPALHRVVIQTHKRAKHLRVLSRGLAIRSYALTSAASEFAKCRKVVESYILNILDQQQCGQTRAEPTVRLP